jgi:hypothetical protein
MKLIPNGIKIYRFKGVEKKLKEFRESLKPMVIWIEISNGLFPF